MKVKANITVRVYPVLERVVEIGVRYGWTRAHKYTDVPAPTDIMEAIQTAVMGELCDALDFDNEVPK